MTTATKRLACCHCPHVSTPNDPVRINWPERSRNAVAMCQNRTRCWVRYDQKNGLATVK